MRKAMAEASRVVLDGFELRIDCSDQGNFPQIIRYPNRFMDKRGKEMWDTVMKHLPRQQQVKVTA
jgi:hypothetical protein